MTRLQRADHRQRPVAIVATYVYFLLFAQYGFIRLIGERGGKAPLVDQAMAGMGVSGLAVSFLAALLLARHPARRLLQLAVPRLRIRRRARAVPAPRGHAGRLRPGRRVSTGC
jgi:hypothetical protein